MELKSGHRNTCIGTVPALLSSEATALPIHIPGGWAPHSCCAYPHCVTHNICGERFRAPHTVVPKHRTARYLVLLHMVESSAAQLIGTISMFAGGRIEAGGDWSDWVRSHVLALEDF